MRYALCMVPPKNGAPPVYRPGGQSSLVPQNGSAPPVYSPQPAVSQARMALTGAPPVYRPAMQGVQRITATPGALPMTAPPVYNPYRNATQRAVVAQSFAPSVYNTNPGNIRQTAVQRAPAVVQMRPCPACSQFPDYDGHSDAKCPYNQEEESEQDLGVVDFPQSREVATVATGQSLNSGIVYNKWKKNTTVHHDGTKAKWRAKKHTKDWQQRNK